MQVFKSVVDHMEVISAKTAFFLAEVLLTWTTPT